MTSSGPSVPSRLLRGYGPLLAFCVVFGLVVAIVPTVGTDVRTIPVAGVTAGADPGSPPELIDGDAQAVRPRAPGQPGPASPHQPSTGEGEPGSLPRARHGTATTATVLGPVTSTSSVETGPRRCPGARQVAGDPYAPGCVAFTGDNGGATSRGVSKDRIRVSIRHFQLPEFAQQSEDGPLAAFAADKESIERTVSALMDYFNQRFQFYGRRLEPVFFEGKGDFATELQGGGQEGAETDGVRVADEIKPFAELLALTSPYADALSRRQVVNLGALFMPRGWYDERHPYAWSTTPDCTFVMESLSNYLINRVAHRPASRAGAAFRSKERRMAVVAPDSPFYQDCVDAGDRILRAAGAPPALRLSYKIDFNTLSNQAASLVAKLRNAEITTVVCGCDPALPIFLTTKAQEQNYEPEWVLVGVPFVDTDSFGQAYHQDQWARAFGLSFAGTPQPSRASSGYFAFKAVRPNEEPIMLVDYLYYQLYPLAIGIQSAGPTLTPETFAQGLYRWPGGTGAAGTWRFSPGQHNPVQDAREIYWVSGKTSPINGRRGTYVESEPGRRHRPGEWATNNGAAAPP